MLPRLLLISVCRVALRVSFACLCLCAVSESLQAQGVTLSPTSLSFGNQVQGTASAVKKVTLKNGQTKAITVTSITSSLSDYTQTNTCPVSPSTLGAGKSCTISVTFNPSALGTRTATLTVVDTGKNSPQTVSLSGTGVAAVTVSSSSLSFGNQSIGVKSAALKVTLTNNQSTALTINSISTTLADYTYTTGCPLVTKTLGAKSSCSISVYFDPTVTGVRNDALAISDNASVSPTVSLTGTGVVAVTVTPSTLTFGSQALGSSSPPQLVTLTNNQSTSLTITGVTSNSSDFTSTTNCPISPATLAAGASCTASVTFAPKAANTRTGALSFTDNASGSPQAVSLTGSGTAANLVSVAVSPANPSIAAGTTQQFTATGTYSDGTTQNLSGSATWTSSASGIGTVSTTGLATGVAAGITTITASSGSISGSTNLTVGAPSLISIAISPANSSFAKGTTEPLKATGTYSDGSTQDLTNSVTWSSGDLTVATINAQGVASAVSVGTTSISAVSGAISGSTNISVAPATLVSIAVTPAIPSIPLGTTQQFTATGTFTDGSTQNITSTVQWSSDTPPVATISNASTTIGLATGDSQGSAKITATSGSITGSTTLTVSAAALTSIAVTPANPSIALGTTQQFTATGTFTDSSTQDLTATVAWASDATSIATVKSGLAKSVGIGTVTITATSGTVSGSTDLTVTAATLVSIAINPQTPTTPVGTTQQFTATGTFTDGTTQDLTTTGHWSSSNSDVATISLATGTAGLASALKQGTTSIGIASGSVSATATLIVSPAALVSLAIAPQNATVALGLNQQFTATGTYTGGTTQDLTSTVAWASSDNTVAVISNSLGSYGLASSSGQGTCTISATSGAISSSTSMTVGGADIVSLSVTPNTISVALGYGEQFSATATYSDGSTQDITQTATWTSSAPTVASVNSSGYANSLLPGATTISASASGMSSGAVLTVTQAVPVALTISPATATIYAGSQQQLTATLLYSDGSSLNVTGTIAWISSNPAVASVSAAGLVTGVTGGSTTISGNSNSISGMSTLTVQAFGVAINPGSATIAIGGTQQFTATVYGDSNQAVTWSVDGVQGGNSATGLGTISTTGLYTAPPTVGTHTITATSQDNTSNSTSVTLTIVSAAGAVSASPYFGIDYNVGLPFGTNPVSHAVGRLWDTPGASWPFVQTTACTTSPCPTSFNWTTVDNTLSQMFTNSVRTAEVVLSRTPNFASSNPSSTTCNYWKSGGTGGTAPGQCYPPIDLNNDGTGANQYWRDWVAAYASHVNAAGYTNNHARVAYYEIWNEPDATGFWRGTLDQLMRMQEDAYCIIKGGSFAIRATGETCSQVQSSVKSVTLTGPADPTASILMPSYHPYSNGITLAQAFLYCTGLSAGSNCHNGGFATVDIINFHMKPGTQYPSSLESVMDSWTSAVQAILQPSEAAKPIFLTESGYSASGWTAPYTLDLNQAGYIARLYIYDYFKGYAGNTWYDYTTNNNLLGLGSIAANNAYSQIFSEMVGAKALACSSHENGTGDAAQPSLYICSFTQPDGTAAQWMWDADNTGEPAFWDTGAPNNLECNDGVCPTLPQSVPGTMLSYVDITGVKTSIANNQVPVGMRPILVQAKP